MRILSLLLAVAALGVAGCGDDDDNGGDTGAAAPPAATTPAQSGGTVEIRMKNFQFDPPVAIVKVGQTVKWINDDTAEHDAVADDGQFKSDQFGKDGTYEFKPTKAGPIPYVCTLHSNMKANLTVTP
ncbi:MAG TPA: cupredoxin domain-containing protein [Solirubrobacteraceae bacterium]